MADTEPSSAEVSIADSAAISPPAFRPSSLPSLPEPSGKIDARDRVIEMLRAQLARLRRMTFGTSSEKLAREIEQLELALEEYEAKAAIADASTLDAARSERPAPVRSLPPHLPRDEIVHEPATCTCTCLSCGSALRCLGADADEMLDVVPVSWRVVRNIRPKYSCRACDAIVQAPAPAKPIARGKATFGTLAHVAVAKFDHHLPLYRQAEMMAAQGVEISRSTLAGWIGQAAHLLDSTVQRIREEGLKVTKFHADDTPEGAGSRHRQDRDRQAVGLCRR